jgi:hypothetical protein
VNQCTCSRSIRRHRSSAFLRQSTRCRRELRPQTPPGFRGPASGLELCCHLILGHPSNGKSVASSSVWLHPSRSQHGGCWRGCPMPVCEVPHTSQGKMTQPQPCASCSKNYFDADSPDESQTGINVRVLPALLQDRREVLTATSTSGNPNAWSRV